MRVRGFYAYIDDKGEKYRVDYTSDENGFVPQLPQHMGPQPQPVGLPPRVIQTLLGRKWIVNTLNLWQKFPSSRNKNIKFFVSCKLLIPHVSCFYYLHPFFQQQITRYCETECKASNTLRRWQLAAVFLCSSYKNF